MIKVFIDGQEGTTGLKIANRLAGRRDVELLTIGEEKRKDAAERKMLINGADIVFLCLPDSAAKESVSLVENPAVRIIDASTAHRTDPDWVYGFPELTGEKRVAEAMRVAVPGCHASGFNAIVYPLVKSGIMPSDYPVVCHSETGYSGGGKSMIAEYTAEARSPLLEGVRQYALNQAHEHQPEMKYICGLKYTPVFNPAVGSYYSGMCVTVPLYTHLLAGDKRDISACLSQFYQGKRLINVKECEGGFLSSVAYAGRDDMLIAVSGNDQRVLVSAVFDNLGKGASGAALQCLNLMTGADEAEALVIGD